MSAKPPSAATKLVEIAEDLFTFGCLKADKNAALYEYASPKGNPDLRRPLPEIRADLAEVFQAAHGAVPAASALGDAMTVLSGKARLSEPETASENILAAFLAGGCNTATELVKLAEEKFTFGITVTGEVFAVSKDGPNVARVLRGGRRSLRAELARIFYAERKSTANAQALADALLVLEGKAQGAEPVEVALRVARDPDSGRLVLDLGAEDGFAVLIGPHGWEITNRSPVLFWRTNATLPLPAPDDLGTIEDLRGMLNVSDDDWTLLLAWLVSALVVDMPHPVLLLRGEHGTAKSTAARLLTSVLDRCASQLRTAPRNVEDWAVACAGSWMTCLDNVSNLQPWLQDAMCRAVTGDGLLRRQLYTDADVSVIAFRRVVAMTSIDPGVLAGDLADRLLTVELERISDDQRTSEADMEAKWNAIRAGVLGGLLHLAVDVLRALGPIRHQDLPRMADFARIVLAVDEVRGTNGYKAYEDQAGRTAENVADSDQLILAIREHITTEWTGTAGALLAKLTPEKPEKPPKDWPTSPQGMGGHLTRAAPVLRGIGWKVERPERTDKARGWTLIPPADAQASDMSDNQSASSDNQAAPNHAQSDMSDVTDNHAGTSSHGPISRHPNLSVVHPSDGGPCARCGTTINRYGDGGSTHCAECKVAL